jgi:hypothetical protein
LINGKRGLITFYQKWFTIVEVCQPNNKQTYKLIE